MKRVFTMIGIIGIFATVMGGCLIDSESMVLPICLFLGGMVVAGASFYLRKVVSH